MAWLTSPADDALIEALWTDAPTDVPDLCNLYLSAAKAACIAYAPALPDAAAVPDEYKIAQAMQARNIYNSGLAAPGGEFDGSSYGVSAFPLDWQVKQLLRPQAAVGAII